MMKFSLAVAMVALLAGCQVGVQPMVESIRYRLIQGELWQGVKVAEQAPRTSQSICQNQQCFRLSGPLNYPQPLLQKYRLQGVSYNALARAVGADDGQVEIELPADLGRFLFNEARQHHHRSMRSGSGIWLAP